ncbi:MAG: HPr-rel-A system PqqD family peptide chaperone [Candidatus Nitrotoga sp.]
MASNIKWRVISDQALHFRSWGGELIVYNSLSGDTHLLGSVAAQILLRLQQVPSDFISLVESLTSLLQTEMMGEPLEPQLVNILADLKALALIERT